MCAKCEFTNLPIFFHILVELALRRILNTINGYFQASMWALDYFLRICKFAIVKEWSRNSQGPLEFKIWIFFLHNKIEDALGRILSTINVDLCAKMCEKQCKTCFFALARSSLLESIRWWYSKFTPERPLSDSEKNLHICKIDILQRKVCEMWICKFANFFFIFW